jgi:tetratricopeptide (TPR) repeat protein
MLLTPHGDHAEGLKLIEKSIALSPENSNKMNTLALGYYRAGKYAAALELTAKLTQAEEIEVLDWLIHAMVQHRLDKPDEAKASWDKTAALLSSPEVEWRGRSNDRLDWADRLFVRTLRDEAAAVLAVED